MARACKHAGIVHRSPHDLRHRRVSLWIKQGIPITEVAAAAGHSRASLTTDVYGHVLVD
jgi:integrase